MEDMGRNKAVNVRGCDGRRVTSLRQRRRPGPRAPTGIGSGQGQSRLESLGGLLCRRQTDLSQPGYRLSAIGYRLYVAHNGDRLTFFTPPRTSDIL